MSNLAHGLKIMKTYKVLFLPLITFFFIAQAVHAETPAMPENPPETWLTYHLAHPVPELALDPNPAFFWKGRYHLHNTPHPYPHHLAILPEYFCELHSEAIRENITERQFIKELKSLLKICGLRQVKEALQIVEYQTADLFPLELLKTSSLPTVHQFTQDTLLRKLT